MSSDAPWTPGHLPKGDLPPAEDGETLARLLGDAAELIDHLSAAASRQGAPDRPELFGELSSWQDAVRSWITDQAAITGGRGHRTASRVSAAGHSGAG
jgi:hypothetical protein